jgi:excisionase family DNA binding protein
VLLQSRLLYAESALEYRDLARKALISTRLGIRRGLSEEEAAAYLSLSRSFFRKLVEEGKMPRPRLAGARRIYDVEELDRAFRELPREGEGNEPAGDSWSDYE